MSAVGTTSRRATRPPATLTGVSERPAPRGRWRSRPSKAWYRRASHDLDAAENGETHLPATRPIDLEDIPFACLPG